MVLRLGFSLLGSLCFWTVNFTRVSLSLFFSPLPKGETQWLQLAKVGIFPLPGQLASDKI